MDKTAKFEYQNEVEKYLEEKRVYDVFEEMMKVLIVKKPDDPLGFLVNYLKVPQSLHSSLFRETDILGGSTWLQCSGKRIRDFELPWVHLPFSWRPAFEGS